MTEVTKVRLSKAAKEFNIGIDKIIAYLEGKGLSVENNPNAKLTSVMYDLLTAEFHEEKQVREVAQKRGLEYLGKETISIESNISKSETSDVDEFIPDQELIIKNLHAGFSTEKTFSKPKTQIPKETKAADEIAEIEEKEKPKVVKGAEAEAEDETEPVQETKKEPATEPAQTEETNDKTEAPKGVTIIGNIDLDSINQKTRPKKKTKAERLKEEKEKRKTALSKKKEETEAEKQEEKKTAAEKPARKEQPAALPEAKKQTLGEEPKKDNFIKTKYEKLSGIKVIDKIELPEKTKKKSPVASSSNLNEAKKPKRRRIRSKVSEETTERDKRKPSQGGRKHEPKHEPSEEEIQKQIKDTLARLAPLGKSKGAKHRRIKRESISQNMLEELQRAEDQKKILKVTEFLTANELAVMMNVGVTEIIKTCMQIGMFVSINQRIGAETISLVAEEFGYQVEFVSADDSKELSIEEMEDDPAFLVERAPIVTVMGHVDHGKTKLLDYIRKTNVVAGEAGGITQHIGAYEVTIESGKKITFLDTPGHEAFTAMRARGAKVTDIAIIVIAADDSVMPQTKEAINHAQAAGVPIVFAFNKMDKPGANADKIREQLSTMNILVEEWGGKYQSQEISAITGAGIDDLLEKVLLEAEILELKANPEKHAKGTVIEASLDKGRGYIATILVQDGTMKKGNVIIAGPVFGKIKAMFNERNNPIEQAGPSTPVVLLGLTAAPQAGDVFNVMDDEREAKQLASKRQQLMREQSLRTQKHITLDEIGRRIAIGDFKELNIIVKGDVDGSVEALADELLKLSANEVQVNVIHKAVGAITESDVMLASASDAIIIGFQVRPVPQARKLAEKEEIDIRLYSIIYQATEEIKAAVEGMLSPKTEEKVTCNIEVREVFNISKVGTIAGCYVLDGKVTRNTKIRLIRDGIVIHTGNLGSLKRFKDDVKEVGPGYECGLNIDKFNDIKVGDIIEGYEIVNVKSK